MENSNLETIKKVWLTELSKFGKSNALQRLFSGNLKVEHYKSILREIYFHTRENPQLQTFASLFFKGDQRKYVKQFFKHASSEVGHDQLALNDLKFLGGNIDNIPNERPLPETSALIAYPFYHIQFGNPIGYLGYLFYLEFTPTSQGANYMDALEKIGVPKEAMTFIHDHSTIDVGHNKLMEGYAADLIQGEEDIEDVIYSVKVTGRLYTLMLEAAINRVDTNEGADLGRDLKEAKRRNVFSSVEL
jgi:hypothetical protein